MHKVFFSILLLVCAGSMAFTGTIIHVPADQPTIQAAINAAVDSDTIIVSAGTYSGAGNRDLDFGGKKIVIKGVPGPASVTIDCGGTPAEHHGGFIFHNGETISSTIQGFTITNAYFGDPYPDTAAIYCVGASPGIINCVITGNTCTGIGSEDGAHPYIGSCVISHNTKNGVSAGVPLWPMAWVDMYDCLVYENGSDGMLIVSPGTFTIANCTVVMNHQHGIFLEGDPPKNANSDLVGLFTKCVVAYNRAGGFVRGFWFPGLTLTCNDAFGNPVGDYLAVFAAPGDTLGNISLDPKFCDTVFADFHIADVSPCRAEANSCNALMGAYDVGCTAGFVCGDFDGNGSLNVSDAVALVAYVFAGGKPPSSFKAADTNGDGHINISDAVTVIIYIFGGGSLNCLQ